MLLPVALVQHLFTQDQHSFTVGREGEEDRCWLVVLDWRLQPKPARATIRNQFATIAMQNVRPLQRCNSRDHQRATLLSTHALMRQCVSESTSACSKYWRYCPLPPFTSPIQASVQCVLRRPVLVDVPWRIDTYKVTFAAAVAGAATSNST